MTYSRERKTQREQRVREESTRRGSKDRVGECLLSPRSPAPRPRGPAPSPRSPALPPAPRPHLGVGGPIDDLSLPQPDDGGCRLGIVCMAGEVEWVPRPQADHRAPQDDRVVRRHCGERSAEVRLRAPLATGRAGRLGWLDFMEPMTNSNYTLIKCIIPLYYNNNSNNGNNP